MAIIKVTITSLIHRLASVSAKYVLFVQEYEELNHKLNVFKEREQDLRERLHNYLSRQNHNKTDENTNKMGMIKLKLPPNQNFNSQKSHLELPTIIWTFLKTRIVTEH